MLSVGLCRKALLFYPLGFIQSKTGHQPSCNTPQQWFDNCQGFRTKRQHLRMSPLFCAVTNQKMPHNEENWLPGHFWRQHGQQSDARRAHGRAPRSAQSVAAGDRTFRRRCRLNDRKENRLIVVNLFGLCPFPHQSSATGTLLLQKEIYPQKSLPNLRQLVFLPLTKWPPADFRLA